MYQRGNCVDPPADNDERLTCVGTIMPASDNVSSEKQFRLRLKKRCDA